MLLCNHRFKPSFLLLLASTFVPLLAAASDKATAQGIAWRHDLAAAQAEASQANKLVLIHFWTETCGPCKRLEKLVFNSPGVATSIARDYVPVKINAAVSQDITSKYGITRVPTDVVITPSGEFVKAFVSPATPMAYVGIMGDVASTYRSQNTAFNQIAAAAPFSQSPANQQLPPNGQPINPAYSGLAASTPPTAQPAAPSSAPKQTPYDRYAAAAPQPPVDRYAMNEPTTPVTAAPAVVSHPQPVAPVTPAPVVPVTNPHYTAPAAAPAASVAPPTPATPQAAAPTPKPPNGPHEPVAARQPGCWLRWLLPRHDEKRVAMDQGRCEVGCDPPWPHVPVRRSSRT